MTRARNLGAVARALAVLTLAAGFMVDMALGQAGATARFQVPYGFLVGAKALPAGEYTFSTSTAGRGSWWNRPPATN